MHPFGAHCAEFEDKWINRVECPCLFESVVGVVYVRPVLLSKLRAGVVEVACF